MPKSKTPFPKKIFRNMIKGSQKISGSDPILAELKYKNRPIIWSFGLPTRTILYTRQKYARKLAYSLGFKYINLDEQISNWVKQFTEKAMRQSVDPTLADIDKPANKKVHLVVTPRMDSVIFKLRGCSVSLKIVPTRSGNKNPKVRKNIYGVSEYVTEIPEANILKEQARPFHIVEQLNRNKILELLKFAMYENPSASGFIIDGFPKDLTDVKIFERTIYRAASAIYWAHSKSSEQTKNYIPNNEQSENQNTEDLAKESLHYNNKVKELKGKYNSKVDEECTPKDSKSYTILPKNRKILQTNPTVHFQIQSPKMGRRRKVRSNPSAKRPLANVTGEHRDFQECKNRKPKNTGSREKRKSVKKRDKSLRPSSKKVTIGDVDIIEEIGSENFDSNANLKSPWKGFYGKEFNQESTSKKKQSDCAVVAQIIHPKGRPFLEFPKYAIRYGQYTRKESESIFAMYGNKAIKLENADLLRFHPKVTNIMVSILEDLLLLVLHKTNYMFGNKKKVGVALESGSNRSINFSVGGFKYKPVYPGLNKDASRCILSKVQRLIHPLMVHHEQIKDPTVIPMDLLIEAINDENRDILDACAKQKLELKASKNRASQEKITKSRDKKAIIRGRRRVTRINSNGLPYDNEKLFQLPSILRNLLYPAFQSDSTQMITKYESILELELETAKSEVFLYNSVASAVSLKYENNLNQELVTEDHKNFPTKSNQEKSQAGTASNHRISKTALNPDKSKTVISQPYHQIAKRELFLDSSPSYPQKWNKVIRRDNEFPLFRKRSNKIIPKGEGSVSSLIELPSLYRISNEILPVAKPIQEMEVNLVINPLKITDLDGSNLNKNEKLDLDAKVKIPEKVLTKQKSILCIKHSDNFCDSVCQTDFDLDLDHNIKKNISLVHDSLFCPVKYEANNNNPIIMEMMIENNQTPISSHNVSQIVKTQSNVQETETNVSNPESFNERTIPSSSLALDPIAESDVNGDTTANQDRSRYNVLYSKRLCKYSRIFEGHSRFHNRRFLYDWVTPYMDGSFRPYQNLSYSGRVKSRFWSLSEIERYMKREQLNSLNHNQEADNISIEDYTDVWKSDWIGTFEPPGKEVSFLKRLCDSLCLCLRKYNKDTQI